MLPDKVIHVVVRPVMVPVVTVAPAGPQGTPGDRGAPGGGMISGWWNYAVATAAPPASSEVRTTPDPPVAGDPYTIFLSGRDRDGVDWSLTGFGTIDIGDKILLRSTDGHTQHCTVTAPGTRISNYMQIETILDVATGAIGKNADVRIDLIRSEA